MKRIAKILAWILGISLLGIILFAAYIQFKGIPSYPTKNVTITVNPSPEKLERGEILVSTLCAGCHMDRESLKLTGRVMLDAPKEFGLAYAPNITQDDSYGIGTWTDGEIAYLLRTGIKRDGSYAPPWMAKLPHLSDYDMESVLVFLRSDHPLVNAAAVEDRPCEPSFLTKLLCNVAFLPFEYPSEAKPQPDTSDPIAHGRYLVFNLECFSCHSADFKTNNYLNPEKSVGYLGGGNKPLDLEGNVMLTQNISSHPEFGIGSISEEKFVKMVKYGQKEGEVALRYPMLPYSRLSDKEVKAIYAYLMSTPPVDNDIPRSGLD